MPNMFLNMDQQVIVTGMGSSVTALKSMSGQENANLEFNCTFIEPGTSSSCGFIVASENFESGGFLVSETNDAKQFLIKAKGLAKVKVYEMQITAFENKSPLVIDSVSVKGSSMGMSATLPNGCNDPTFEFDGNTLVGVKGKIGTKKSDVK